MPDKKKPHTLGANPLKQVLQRRAIPGRLLVGQRHGLGQALQVRCGKCTRGETTACGRIGEERRQRQQRSLLPAVRSTGVAKEASMVYAGRWRWWSGGRRWKVEEKGNPATKKAGALPRGPGAPSHRLVGTPASCPPEPARCPPNHQAGPTVDGLVHGWFHGWPTAGQPPKKVVSVQYLGSPAGRQLQRTIGGLLAGFWRAGVRTAVLCFLYVPPSVMRTAASFPPA